ncbi:syntaxin-binding protein 5-like isoform X4 [Petromyzon marinus]|uniref:syntaxin-binding protein 5-like isoform X4 n=1 Tax=Petromyzon marinus TaxID=7757 RepID=UPI003F70A584
MRKIKRVLDGLTTPASPQAAKPENEIHERLGSDHFQLCKTVRHGFPHQPTALAFDPVQKILAIGTRNGALRLLGRPGVDCHCQHDNGAAVIQLQFLINEGALVSVSADDSLNLWNLRQKRPAVLHSLKFNRERITCCHLPFQSKWLYIGTERGNIHIVNVESFVLSGYVIMWNKAIELSTKSHPGPVVHISDNPRDDGKLLIGYENGTIVSWDLKSKKVEYRYYYDEAIHSVAWHHEGKQFICSHSDGSLTTWAVRSPAKPLQVLLPHAKPQKDGKKPDPCKPILKVEYKTSKMGEAYVVFSGGLSYDKAGRRPSVTVMHGKSVSVLEMDFQIVDFMTLCETPYPSELQDPYAVVVLLEKDLVVIDLTQAGYPVFENPYAMDVHESPVTCCEFIANCPTDIVPALFSVGARQKRHGYSKKEWPISGGSWGLGTQSYPEIIITGHADGSLKFWDASAINLQMLYRLKTSKVFEKARGAAAASGAARPPDADEDPYAVQMVALCPESRVLAVAGVAAHTILYRFSKTESTGCEVTSLEVRLQYEAEGEATPEGDQVPSFPSPGPAGTPSQPLTMRPIVPSGGPCPPDGLKVKSCPLRQAPGYQAELVVQLQWVDGEPPQQITSLALNSAYGLVAFGNSNGLAIVDFVQKSVLLNLGTVELYGSNDPYQRQPRSPRKGKQQGAGSTDVSCMRRLSISSLWAGSCKRLRTSYSSFSSSAVWAALAVLRLKALRSTHSAPDTSEPAGLGEITEGASAQDSERCKSPTAVRGKSRRVKSPSSVADLEQPDVGTGATSPGGEAVAAPSWAPSARRRFYSADGAGGAGGPRSRGRAGGGPRSGVRAKTASTSSSSSSPAEAWPPGTNGDAGLGLGLGLAVASNARESRDNSFSRSRSSSVSSIEKEAREAITALCYADSFGCRAAGGSPSPCLWVGTSLGTVMGILLTLPSASPAEARLSQPVIVSPSGTVFRLKGAIMRLAFLGCDGSLTPPPAEPWRDPNSAEERDERDGRLSRKRRPVSVSPSQSGPDLPGGGGSGGGPGGGGGVAGGGGGPQGEQQFMLLCSEKQAKVVSLPSQAVAYKHSITETSFVLRGDAVSLGGAACLAAFCAHGHIMAFSLPSLRPLLDVNYLPVTDMRIARTFCFANEGQALYMSSPTEIQRLTCSQDMCENLQEMLGELFTPVDTPEAPNRGFFKGLFGGSAPSVDREELFGETAGKASRSLAQHIPGSGSVEGVRGAATGVAADLARARLALDERGQRLGELEDRTAAMLASADTFSKHAHDLMLKYKDKKWYQF